MTVETLSPPVARTVEHVDTIHGDPRVDNYAWLREKSNPEVTRLPGSRERLHGRRDGADRGVAGDAVRRR